jgi:very-short-patch-repair endonuclease
MKEYKDNLFYAAKPDIFKKASVLKHEMTSAEKMLWKYLRNRKLNRLKFRRQHPLDIFIVDFYCHEKKLIIEVDGGIHDDEDQKEYDEGRSFELKEKGYKILRFTNKEVLNNINNVADRIIKFSQSL